jgi:hypothetical protein
MLFVLWVAEYNMKEGEGRDKKEAKNKIRASRISRKMLVFILPSPVNINGGWRIPQPTKSRMALNMSILKDKFKFCKNVDM